MKKIVNEICKKLSNVARLQIAHITFVIVGIRNHHKAMVVTGHGIIITYYITHSPLMTVAYVLILIDYLTENKHV